jgi:hypothetical protein
LRRAKAYKRRKLIKEGKTVLLASDKFIGRTIVIDGIDVLKYEGIK